MRIASVRHATSPGSLPVAAAIVGGDAPVRHRTARLLVEGGFSLSDPGAAPDLLLLLLSRATDAERVGELRAACDGHPGAQILAVMPAGASNASLRRALLAGAHGIVFDAELECALVPTARAVLAGQLTVPPVLGRQIAPRPLSHREKEILALVMLGRTNREIARTLFLAESTVKTHLSSAFRKLDARSRSEAVTRITDPENVYGPTILEMAHGPLAAAG